MSTQADARLRILHHPDGRWYVYYVVNRRDLGTNEYIFDTFEEVSRWVENRYWEMESEVQV